MILRSTVIRAACIGLLLLFSCAARSPLHPIITPENQALTDPEIIHGVLPNGFQYILKKNTTPKDRVSVHLNVFAGSMHETDEELGVAHFLEHMLFNGSEHYAPGELARYFPSIGMDFGADANAHTSFFNTVYDLALPSGDKKQMDEAFVIIQDYAKGALLLESEVDRERGIILAEKRERDSVSYRTFKETMGFEYPGSLFALRFPIGTEEVIKTVNRKELKSFYDQWYRPENLSLVVVGDFDVPTVRTMIENRFSQLKPRAQFLKVPLNTQWEPHKGQKAFYHHEPEAGSTDVTIQTVVWEPFTAKTLDHLKRQTLMYLANTMIQNRLSRMVLKQNVDFSEASAFSGSFLHHVSVSAISAACEPGKWQKVLEQIEHTLRQGILYGFDQKELDRVKADYLAMLEQHLDQAQTQKTSHLARRILGTVNQKGLLLSAGQRKDVLAPYVESITTAETQLILQELWAKDHRLILVTGNAKIDSTSPENAILETYKKSATKMIGPYKGFQSKTFPYLDQPTDNAEIKSRQNNVNGLGVNTIEFENNVRLNFKKTDFKQNEFSFKVCFGSGRLSEPISKPGLSRIAQTVVDDSGFGQMDVDQLEEALAGKKVGISFGIHDNYFSLSGSADPKEAALVFDLIRHYFKDPGYRQEPLNLAKIRYQQQYDAMLRTPQGIMRIKGESFLAKEDPWFGWIHPDDIKPYTLEDIQAWLSPQFENASVEISIVGDFDPETLVRVASKYMGNLGTRQKFPVKKRAPQKIHFPAGEKLKLELDTKIDAGVVRVIFLTDDFWDIQQTRRLSILSRVVSERLRLLLREELGETYSPYVYNDPSMIFDGYGLMHVVVNVNPDSHDLVFAKINEIIDSLVDNGVSKEETTLSLKPVINHIQTLRRTNGYWLNAVMANASQYPQKYQWAQTMMEDYSAISSQDLIGLVKKYLKMENSAKIIISSKGISD